MSTFMAYGAVDLQPGMSADPYVAALNEVLAGEDDADRPLEIWIDEVAGRARITMLADYGNIWLGRVVVQTAGDVERVLLGLDHDEYGAEHAVLDGRGGSLLRVHHVYVYPDNEQSEECPPILTEIPSRDGIVADPDGTLAGADALAAAAALYDVDSGTMVRAVRAAANAFESLGIVGMPLDPWWRALGVSYPIPDLGEPALTLRRPSR